MYIYLCVYIYIYIHTSTHIYVYTSKYIYIYIYVSTRYSIINIISTNINTNKYHIIHGALRPGVSLADVVVDSCKNGSNKVRM